MAKLTFKQIAKVALAVATFFGAQVALAEVVAGTHIKLSSGGHTGTGGGGAFYGTVVPGTSSGDWNNTFESFCVEYSEHIGYQTEYEVRTVSDHTVSNITGDVDTVVSANGDKISEVTAWLFTQFYQATTPKAGNRISTAGTLFQSGGVSSFTTTALQEAIWYAEHERTKAQLTTSNQSTEKNAVSFYEAAVSAVDGGWRNNNKVQVLNLFGKDKQGKFTVFAQDQLYMTSAVPEPETYAMMLAGLGLMGAIARRRKAKSA